MPIKKENKHHYPPDWKAISHRIRFERAGGRCECVGECGKHLEDRCEHRHGEEIDGTAGFRVKVVLTTAHHIHGPDCSDENLIAMCQRCHLNYDAKMHAANARRTREAKSGQSSFASEHERTLKDADNQRS